jgi:hypothetical protein
MGLVELKEERTANSTYPKDGVSCSVDSFVVAESFVLRIKIPPIENVQNVMRHDGRHHPTLKNMFDYEEK